MRIKIFISLVLFGLSCTSLKHVTMKANQINGTWVPVQEELGGVLLPKTVFENQKLIISDNGYTLIAESVDKGNLNYRDGKMDIFGKEGVNSGKHFTAIYKYENEQLTVCYNLSGDRYPEAFTTKGNPSLFLAIFKKRMTK